MASKPKTTDGYQKTILMITIAILAIIVGSVFYMNATIPKSGNIVKAQLIESQYGVLGDIIGVGDRLYIATLKDGTNIKTFSRTSNPLFAKILEGDPYSTVWVTEGKDIFINMRVYGLNLPQVKRYTVTNNVICGITTTGTPGASVDTPKTCDASSHTFELMDEPSGGFVSYMIMQTVPIQAPIQTQTPPRTVPVTLVKPGGLQAGKYYPTLFERIELTEGKGYAYGTLNGASDIVMTIIATQTLQAAQPTPAVTPIATSTAPPENPYYIPPIQTILSVEAYDIRDMVASTGDIDPTKGVVDLSADVQISGAGVGKTSLMQSFNPGQVKIAYIMKTGYVQKVVTLSTTSPTCKFESGTACRVFMTPIGGVPTATPTATATATAAAPGVTTPVPGITTPAPEETTPTPGVTLSEQDQAIADAIAEAKAAGATDKEIQALQLEAERLKAEKRTPGFEAVFAITALLAVAGLAYRQRRGKQ